MSRWRNALMVPLVVAACTPAPSPASTSLVMPASPSAAAATLSITASGTICGPWWMGCGAVLAIEAPGWTLPDDWAPAADDTQFAVDLIAGSERPTRVTGVRQQGQDRIEPGDYLFVGIMTMSPDSQTPGTLQATVGCSKAVKVPPGARAVRLDIEFASACSMDVSMDVPSPARTRYQSIVGSGRVCPNSRCLTLEEGWPKHESGMDRSLRRECFANERQRLARR